MALIVSENNNRSVVGIENLIPGVYSFTNSNGDTSLMIVSGPPKKSRGGHRSFKAGTLLSGERYAGCYVVDPCGTISTPVLSRWDSIEFTRVADTFDIVVPGTR